jgi:Stress responsive A/B Barrel Domain
VLVPANAADTDKSAGGRLLSHDVFFTLQDHSAEARQKFVESCKKYLDSHPGTVAFSAGARAEDVREPVSDTDFDVAVHVLFRDKAAHDEYLQSERHKQFVQENKGAWSKVRVFDSYVERGQEK